MAPDLRVRFFSCRRSWPCFTRPLAVKLSIRFLPSPDWDMSFRVPNFDLAISSPMSFTPSIYREISSERDISPFVLVLAVPCKILASSIVLYIFASLRVLNDSEASIGNLVTGQR